MIAKGSVNDVGGLLVVIQSASNLNSVDKHKNTGGIIIGCPC